MTWLNTCWCHGRQNVMKCNGTSPTSAAGTWLTSLKLCWRKCEAWFFRFDHLSSSKLWDGGSQDQKAVLPEPEVWSKRSALADRSSSRTRRHLSGSLPDQRDWTGRRDVPSDTFTSEMSWNLIFHRETLSTSGRGRTFSPHALKSRQSAWWTCLMGHTEPDLHDGEIDEWWSEIFSRAFPRNRRNSFWASLLKVERRLE